jgi:hypothetical protein
MSPSDSGLSFGLRSGYAVPLGNVQGSITILGQTLTYPLTDYSNGLIPIWADIGYRFSPNWYLGAFYQYGIGLLPSKLTGTGGICSAGVSCTEWSMRFGLNVHYHFMPGEKLDPWVGLGAGYEISNLNGSQGAVSGSVQVRGFEFGNAQFGLDFALSSSFAIGPFVAFSVGQYTDASVSGSFTPIFGTSGSIANKDIHEWLIFGARGVFNLNM